MSHLTLLSSSIFFLFFLITTFASSSFNNNHKCPEKQSEALLLFKHNLSSINYPIDDCGQNVPKMMSWNTSSDCCNWDGVWCDDSTGDVIVLDLRCGMLQGTIHPLSSLFNLTHLTELDLSLNNLNGTLPSWLFTSPSLEQLYLFGNMFSGNVPSDISINLTHLTSLGLGGNSLNGTLPSWLFSSPSLESLDLFGNMFSGNVPSDISINLTHLIELDLSDNKLNGTLPSWLFTSPSLQYLYLDHNMFSGNVPFESFASPSLRELYLSNNQLGGQIDVQTFPQLTNLSDLDLSFNNFSGELELDTLLSTLTNLQSLYLSYSGFSVTTNNTNHYVNLWLSELYLASCKLKVFPNSLRAMGQLKDLDLSSNLIEGPFPPSICNISSSLYMIDMGNNSFQGTIPNTFGDCRSLEGLILKGNQLEGEVPSSLSKCESLKVVDFGKNHLNGTFPGWLGALPNLQALVLKSNNFHGHIQPSATVDSPFPSLRVLDLSHNRFVGQLPAKYFQSFSSMKNVVKNSTAPEYIDMGDSIYYSFVVVVKGVDQNFPQISVDYTIIDLSCNTFEGQIPNVIGGLNSLIVLNLSHNSLVGPIPHALGNLTEIESLDLSSNQLSGEIPQSLAGINTLEVLNLSQNRLVGRIPDGTQFSTFEEKSFEGNLGLCGPPKKKCSEHTHKKELESHEEESGFTWEVVMLGYGCGTLLGLVMGYLMLSTRKVKWFNAIADATESLVLKKKKRRHVYIGK